MSQPPVLSVSNLSCERDERRLFQGLSFSMTSGDILQILGPNGSGKTTLMRVVAGLCMDFTGQVDWCGHSANNDRPEFQSSLLYIGHQAGIKVTMTPEENLRWSVGLQGSISMDEIWQALARVRLTGYEDVPCYQLSAGQNRRVALARLYLSRQPLWILDEPFTAIDKEGTADLEQALVDHAQSGGMAMMTTHHDLSIDAPGFRQLMLEGGL